MLQTNERTIKIEYIALLPCRFGKTVKSILWDFNTENGLVLWAEQQGFTPGADHLFGGQRLFWPYSLDRPGIPEIPFW